MPIDANFVVDRGYVFISLFPAPSFLPPEQRKSGVELPAAKLLKGGGHGTIPHVVLAMSLSYKELLLLGYYQDSQIDGWR
jgi:hypothetical protein